MKNPGMLVLLLKTSIFIAVQANLHAMVLVVATPIILSAEIPNTLKQKVNYHNLVFGFDTEYF